MQIDRIKADSKLRVQLGRRERNNLVYLPVVNKNSKMVTMVQFNAKDENEAKRWQEHLCAVAERHDKQAFHALYLHFAPKIKSFYLQHGLTTKAEELTNEVFIKVWRKASSYKAKKANVSTWIYTIARNIKIDEYRKKRIATVSDQDTEESEAIDSQIDNQFETLRTGREKLNIRSAMQHMTQQQQQVLHKVYFEDKSHSIVAKELDMTLGEVKSRVRSCLNSLRKSLGVEKA